mmetsp:Transcript_71287/g.220286  ORF Transcript_71287/g.220286 Transcript_71287/m.220286 type:complete len:313 (+) Transcript_71287:74-1012(+)|eukprot:CAMPEP_0204605910 /NCGR_PEP_ID=MMETSP0661-20131031/58774_1 /ASSEMBLY_ACC=CAM_ASM_000606 /TAXON_ID=109239 /ORGANISM="Alexandrium margalefi, Strain AMGDE01CS-322" /LENGTH=312 /DNA_ID=CAMNT_0051617189 /DNA_START=65 /DNA_END=1003 /DNA_ORIENTATION=+
MARASAVLLLLLGCTTAALRAAAASLGGSPPPPRTCTALGSPPGGPAHADDAFALVQVGLAPVDRPKAKGPADDWRLAQAPPGYSFPLEDQGLHFVSSAAFMLRWMEQRIHFYDIALFLHRNSSLWDMHSPRNRSQDLQDMIGNVQLMIVLQSRMASRKSLAALVDALQLFADLRHLKNVTPVLKQYKKCYTGGPRIPQGSMLVLMPNSTGLSVTLNNEPLCTVSSGILSTLVMDHYLGEKSDFPEFRDSVFKQLSEGMPEHVTQPIVISVKSSAPWWVTALLVLLGILACAGVLYIYHNCCRASYQPPAGA